MMRGLKEDLTPIDSHMTATFISFLPQRIFIETVAIPFSSVTDVALMLSI